jgi:hypothetical protein
MKIEGNLIIAAIIRPKFFKLASDREFHREYFPQKLEILA